jgi:hypothetical protein
LHRALVFGVTGDQGKVLNPDLVMMCVSWEVEVGVHWSDVVGGASELWKVRSFLFNDRHNSQIHVFQRLSGRLATHLEFQFSCSSVSSFGELAAVTLLGNLNLSFDPAKRRTLYLDADAY